MLVNTTMQRAMIFTFVPSFVQALSMPFTMILNSSTVNQVKGTGRSPTFFLVLWHGIATHWGALVVIPSFMCVLLVLGFVYQRKRFASLKHFVDERPRAAYRSDRKSKQKHIWKWMLAIAILGIAGIVAMTHKGPFVTQLEASLLFTVSSNAAMFCLVLGFTNWSGRSIVCAKCRYVMPSWRAAPQVCPECGSAWKALLGTAFGQSKTNWRLVFAGVVLSMVAIASIYFLYQAALR